MKIEGSEQPSARWTVLIVLLVIVLSTSGFGLIAPLLPFYATALKAEAWQVAIVFAAYPTGQLAGEPFWGRLSDRIGVRTVLFAALLGLAASYFLFAFATSLGVAIVLRLIAGFMGGHLSTMQNVLISAGPSHNVARRITAMSAATSLGVVLGPMIGGLCVGNTGTLESFRPALVVGSALYACAAVLLFMMLRPDAGKRSNVQRPTEASRSQLMIDLQNPIIWRCFTLNFVGYGAWAIVAAIQGLWLHEQLDWGPRQLGLMLTAGALLAGIFQLFVVGRIIARFGARAMLIGALIQTGAGLLLLPFLPANWMMPACLVLISVTMGAPMSSITSLLAREAPIERRGGLLGINAAAGALGRVGPAIVGGALFSLAGGRAPFLAAGLALWFGAVLAFGARPSGALQDRGAV